MPATPQCACSKRGACHSTVCISRLRFPSKSSPYVIPQVVLLYLLRGMDATGAAFLRAWHDGRQHGLVPMQQVGCVHLEERCGRPGFRRATAP